MAAPHYDVEWKRSALDCLADIWLNSTERSEVTAAVERIDQLLANRPYEVGESRNEMIRVLFSPPLGAFYEVDEPNRIVHVLRVWTF